METTESKNMILGFFLTLFFISIIIMGWLLWPFVSTIILAAVVTGMFNPLYNLIKKRVKPNLASLITCIIIFFILFVPIVFIVGALSKEGYQLYQMGKDAVISNQLKNLLETSKVIEKATIILTKFNIELTGDKIYNAISEIGKTVGLSLFKQSSLIASNVLNFLFHFFFMLLIIYYLLIDKEKLLNFIITLSPLPKDQDEKLIQKFKDISGAILIGNGIGGLIQGVLGGLVFLIFGLSSPLLWGFIMSLLAFLPILGIGVVFIPAAIFLFLKGKVFASIFFIIFYLVLSGIIEYIFKPKLVGKRVKMHTLLVFLSIVGGLKLFGILGIIYGPLVITAFLTLTDIYQASYQKIVETHKEC